MEKDANSEMDCPPATIYLYKMVQTDKTDKMVFAFLTVFAMMALVNIVKFKLRA